MISENLILGLVGMSLISIFGMMALKMWYSLHKDAEIMTKVRGIQTELGKVKTKLRETHVSTTDTPLGIANMQDMTLEQAMEMMGFDAKELNNPLVKPIAEKIFNRLKEGNVENVGQEETGY